MANEWPLWWTAVGLEGYLARWINNCNYSLLNDAEVLPHTCLYTPTTHSCTTHTIMNCSHHKGDKCHLSRWRLSWCKVKLSLDNSVYLDNGKGLLKVRGNSRNEMNVLWVIAQVLITVADSKPASFLWTPALKASLLWKNEWTLTRSKLTHYGMQSSAFQERFWASGKSWQVLLQCDLWHKRDKWAL